MSSIFDIQSFRWIAGGVLVAWSLLQALLLHRYGLSPWLSFADSILQTCFLALSVWLIANTLRYFLPGKNQFIFYIALAVATSMVAFSLFFATTWALFPAHNYQNLAGQAYPVRMAIQLLVTGWATAMVAMWYQLQQARQKDERDQHAAALAREAELMRLRQQLQPHFLFNSLNSINALIGSRPQQARNMVQQLSEFLRATLASEQKRIVTLEQELEQLYLYLEIEKVRFGDRLQTCIHITEDANSCTVPALLLQPLVENAIKFGLNDTLGDVSIDISATLQRSNLRLEISNPFDPQTGASQRGTGFGLASVRRRLYLLFDRTDLLQTQTKGNLFITQITIPQSIQ